MSNAQKQPVDDRLPIPAMVIGASIYVFLIGIPLCIYIIGIPVVVFQFLALRRKAWAAKTNSVIFFLLLTVQIFGIFNLMARGPMGRGSIAFLIMFVTIALNIAVGIIMRQWASTLEAHSVAAKRNLGAIETDEREWTSSKDGQVFRAKYLNADSEFVTLKRGDGKLVKMPQGKLAVRDRAYVDSLKTASGEWGRAKV